MREWKTKETARVGPLEWLTKNLYLKWNGKLDKIIKIQLLKASKIDQSHIANYGIFIWEIMLNLSKNSGSLWHFSQALLLPPPQLCGTEVRPRWWGGADFLWRSMLEMPGPVILSKQTKMPVANSQESPASQLAWGFDTSWDKE